MTPFEADSCDTHWIGWRAGAVESRVTGAGASSMTSLEPDSYDTHRGVVRGMEGQERPP